MTTERLGRELADRLGIDGDSHSGSFRAQVLRRPELSIDDLLEEPERFDREARLVVQDALKYQGYIQREVRQIERARELESLRLPPTISYEDLSGLSVEVREKLSAVRPATLGQASRVPGVTPAAIAVLRVHLQQSEVSRET
jgi:tRNA uridine 5-carboxymethylaminomethyl modification enzyme